MGSSSFFLFLLLLVFLSGSDPFLANGSDAPSLIQNTCKNTKYYGICVSSLKSDPTTSNATDTKGLTLVMVGVAAANATSTSSYLASQVANATNDDVLRRVLRGCADKYNLAAEALRGSAQDLGEEAYDYANVRVMAASDYPNSCRNGFRRFRGLAYPRELASREAGLKRICDVVLGMIGLLASEE